MNGQKFDLGYVEFEHELPKIEERISQKKEDIKKNIKEKLKKEVRVFYTKILNL